MRHPNQEERRNEASQILKEKQQVRKKKNQKMFDTQPQNEEGKIRPRELRRRHEKKKRKIRFIAHCINCMSFSVAFKLLTR